ncbi:MAG: LCCL domain-containing protein [Pseudobdellovibrionaceae bacterium]
MRKPRAVPCNLPWGGSIASGASVTAYQSSSTVCVANCPSQTRTCTNGVLSGTYTHASCTLTYPTLGEFSDGELMNCNMYCTNPGYDYVYGTSYYWSGSEFCRAAVHAGVIGLVGGNVAVYHVPGGCSNFTGSSANGVFSGNYGVTGYPASKFVNNDTCN